MWICWYLLVKKFVKSHQVNLFLAVFSSLEPLCIAAWEKIYPCCSPNIISRTLAAISRFFWLILHFWYGTFRHTRTLTTIAVFRKGWVATVYCVARTHFARSDLKFNGPYLRPSESSHDLVVEMKFEFCAHSARLLRKHYYFLLWILSTNTGLWQCSIFGE